MALKRPLPDYGKPPEDLQCSEGIMTELASRGLVLPGMRAEIVARPDTNEATQTTFECRRRVEAETDHKNKKPKLLKGSEAEISGPLASEMIVNKKMNPETGERRLKPFIPGPNEKFIQKLRRIRNERMFMLGRRVDTTSTGKSEVFEIAGRKGPVYTVTIGARTKCNCQEVFRNQIQCKHIRYVLVIILKAPVWLQYQSAFLKEELDTIFSKAPPARAMLAKDSHEHAHTETSRAVTRKPVEGDCPICVLEMNPNEDTVWCSTACGQNVHKKCFRKWRKCKRDTTLTCAYCSTKWPNKEESTASPEEETPVLEQSPI